MYLSIYSFNQKFCLLIYLFINLLKNAYSYSNETSEVFMSESMNHCMTNMQILFS